MRAAALAFVLLLLGCQAAVPPTVAFAAADVVSIATFHRDGFDLIYSLISGRDCSIVRLDSGLSYCRRADPRPPPQPFCTRTLGVAECFDEAAFLPDAPPPLADGRTTLTQAQREDAAPTWP